MADGFYEQLVLEFEQKLNRRLTEKELQLIVWVSERKKVYSFHRQKNIPFKRHIQRGKENNFFNVV